MPNMDPLINQNEATNKFENQLLTIKDERQKMIRPNCHPTYNERHQKIIELIDWTLEKYKMNMEKTQQQNDEQIIIDNIIEELAKKRDVAIHKKERAMLKDEVWKYSEEEDTIDYILFRIRELTGRLIKKNCDF
ncbi:MAG TPA: hypothetical protein VFC05_16120 [Nitrososphaeraceae archaeon]|nr:hypothetical protein [Nitrososphaeraceae archaeon]